MINDFSFSFATQLEFGSDSLSRLSTAINSRSVSSLMLVYGKNSIKQNGIYDDVLTELGKCDVEVHEYAGCESNPSSEFVNEGKKEAADKSIDLVLGVGGGSVIDASKAIALLINNKSDDIWDYANKRELFTRRALPVGVVLTTAGTGSEVNGGFVINNNRTSEKIGFSNMSVRPLFSICKPEYTFSLNRNKTANNVVDIVSHLVEQYFSENQANDFIFDDLIIATLRNVMKNQDAVFKRSDSYTARSNLMIASSVSLSYLYSMGKTVLWTLHNIEHALSGIYDITHGVGLAALMPGWIRFITENSMYAGKTDILQDKVFKKYGGGSPDLVDSICHWQKTIGLPVGLSEIVDKKESIQLIAERVMRNGAFISKSEFEKEDIVNILKTSWSIR